MRLNDAERQIWQILQSSLSVSEYTDNIDVFGGGNKAHKKIQGIKSMCHIISGLVVSHSYERGQKLEKEMADNEWLYKRVFELGRRAKILNPSSMRETYGKLMWILMDATDRVCQKHVGFDLADAPVKTVRSILGSSEI